MTRSLSLTLLLIFALTQSIYPQDTLPRFSIVVKPANKVLISWTNRYTGVSQISIQRSYDSLRNFTTIVTVPDPSVLQNGFVDSRVQSPFPFYRLFILLEGGKYVFTASRKPGTDIAKPANLTSANRPSDKTPALTKEENKPPASTGLPEKTAPADKGKKPEAKETVPKVVEKPAPPPEKYFYFKKSDSVTILIREKELKHFRDSIFFKTKDTVVMGANNMIEVRPFVPKDVFRPSKYVFTGKDGNVNIVLPEANIRKYSIKFFEPDDHVSVFDIQQVKMSPVILDKTNFVHAGWFRFELYEDGKLKEKNKLLIPKDF